MYPHELYTSLNHSSDFSEDLLGTLQNCTHMNYTVLVQFSKSQFSEDFTRYTENMYPHELDTSVNHSSLNIY